MELNEVTSIDVNEVLSTSPAQLTHKVGVAFDDNMEPTVGFVIVSKDSPQVRDAASRMRALGIKRQSNKRTKIDAKTEDGAEELDKIMQKSDFEIALAAVVDWFGFTSNGQPIPFDPKMVRQMFEVRPSWREKVSADLEADENFLKRSLPSLSNSPVENSN